MQTCNVENMSLFVNALESGEYEQCGGALKRGDKYCCLGVACEVAIAAGVPIEVRESASSGCGCPVCATGDRLWSYDGEGGILPDSVRDWLGISESNPRLSGAIATSWNDGLKASFPVIAQLFRHEYLTAA